MPRVKMFEWLTMLKFLLSFARDVLPLPVVENSAECRAWTLKLLKAIGDAAETTTTEIDDYAVSLLTQCANDDGLWDLLHGILLDVLGKEPIYGSLGEEMADMAILARCQDLGEKVGIDPITIMSIISLIVSLIKLWRDRNKE